MPSSYCIICGKKKNGIKVTDDHVLKTLRWFKTNITKNVQNNTLVVCKTCYPQYSKQRKKYISRRTAYVALGIIFLILSVIISSGAWLTALSIGIFIVILLYALSLINYMPGLQLKGAGKKSGPRKK
jgi:hypothetical protein